MNNTPKENSKQKNEEFTPNFTQYPNEILDKWMPHLTGNQFKIINVFVRQIYGYHKDYNKISIRQISDKTGISVSKVFKDVKILISIGCLNIIKKGTKSEPHTYQIINITDELPEKIINTDPRLFNISIKNIKRKQQNNLCAICNQELQDDCHADHIYPWSKGGKTVLENCQILCKKCNIKKRDKVNEQEKN